MQQQQPADGDLVVFVSSRLAHQVSAIGSALAEIDDDIRVVVLAEPPRGVVDPVGRIVRQKRLTPRQGDVLRLLVCGWSDSEISRALGIGVGTVKDHVAEILRRTGVPSRMRLLALVFGSSRD